METICHRIKLKPNSIQKVEAWAAELKNREEEVFRTLVDEGVFVESVFLDQSEAGDFLVYYMRMESSARTKEVVAKSKHAIDAYHKNFKKETWESRQVLKLLVDFERKS